MARAVSLKIRLEEVEAELYKWNHGVKLEKVEIEIEHSMVESEALLRYMYLWCKKLNINNWIARAVLTIMDTPYIYTCKICTHPCNSSVDVRCVHYGKYCTDYPIIYV